MTQDRLLPEIVKEAERLEEEVLYCYAGHNEEARASDWLHKALGVPTTVLAAAAGVFSFSAVAGSGAYTWPSVLSGALSFGVAAMTGVATFLDPKARSAAHNRAGIMYGALRNDLRYFHKIQCKKDIPVEQLDRELLTLRQRVDKLEEETPIIGARMMNAAEELIKKGHYVYAVDRDVGAPKGTDATSAGGSPASPVNSPGASTPAAPPR